MEPMPAPQPAPQPVSASRTTLSRIMTAVDTNLYGNVHGGVVMKLVDDVGGTVAARHSGGRAVTVAMDEMVFLVPVHVGDLVYASAQVNWAGRSSLEVGVRVTAERWDQAGGQPTHVASSYLVYVGIDDAERPRIVPPLVTESAADERRFREAQIRRQTRLARREAILASRSGG